MSFGKQLPSTPTPRSAKTLRRQHRLENNVEIIHTDVDANEERDSAVDDEKNVYDSRMSHMFKRVICDEAHAIKNTRTKANRSILTLYAPVCWMMSATPMLNRSDDLLGFLLLL